MKHPCYDVFFFQKLILNAAPWFEHGSKFLRESCFYNNITDLINMLPGNSSVNTVQRATIDEAVFSVTRATPSAGNRPMNSQSDT
jgi:hypothetical protein